MIQLSNGWAQWDYQIGTFRAEVDGVVHGVYTGEYPTAESLASVVTLSNEEVSELALYRDDMIQGDEPLGSAVEHFEGTIDEMPNEVSELKTRIVELEALVLELRQAKT